MGAVTLMTVNLFLILSKVLAETVIHALIML